MHSESKIAVARCLWVLLAVIGLGSAVVLTAAGANPVRRLSSPSSAKTALHLRHAPAGRAGSSRQLPDLRHETHADPQAGRRDGRDRAADGERKIKYYKSTMMPGEVRQTPGKDSMGMDMAPVYEEEAAPRIPPSSRSIR